MRSCTLFSSSLRSEGLSSDLRGHWRVRRRPRVALTVPTRRHAIQGAYVYRCRCLRCVPHRYPPRWGSCCRARSKNIMVDVDGVVKCSCNTSWGDRRIRIEKVGTDYHRLVGFLPPTEDVGFLSHKMCDLGTPTYKNTQDREPAHKSKMAGLKTDRAATRGCHS